VHCKYVEKRVTDGASSCSAANALKKRGVTDEQTALQCCKYVERGGDEQVAKMQIR
jgi:hypothetical protein